MNLTYNYGRNHENERSSKFFFARFEQACSRLPERNFIDSQMSRFVCCLSFAKFFSSKFQRLSDKFWSNSNEILDSCICRCAQSKSANFCNNIFKISSILRSCEFWRISTKFFVAKKEDANLKTAAVGECDRNSLASLKNHSLSNIHLDSRRLTPDCDNFLYHLSTVDEQDCIAVECKV